MYMRKIIIILAILSIPTSSWAQLYWENKFIRRTVQSTEKQVLVTFKFQNVGKDTITIKSIKSSCGCTTAEMAKKNYKGGEAGQLVVTFDPGSRTGIQNKSVVLETDQSTDSVIQLDMEFTLPTVLDISPGKVFWGNGEAKETKVIKLTLSKNVTPFNVIDVSSSNEDFIVKLKTIKPGSQYEIKVTPTQTIYPAKATLRIQTDTPSTWAHVFYAGAEVSPPK